MTQRANGQQNIFKLIESCSWSVIAGDAFGAFWLKTNSKWFLFLVAALFTQFHALNEVDACLHQEQTSHTTPPRLWIDLFTFLFSLRICTRFGLARKEISLVNQVDHELETEFFARVARKRSQIRGIRSMRFVKFLSADYFPLDWRGVWLNFLAFVLFAVLNVAAGKAPMQISTDGAGIPQKAIDGSTSSFFSADTCSLTKSERVPWWYVNLLEPYMVQLVRLDFGKSCCGKWNRTCFVWNHHPACKECCRTWDSAFLCGTVFGANVEEASRGERDSEKKLSPILFSSLFLFKVHMQINSKPKNH